MNNPAVLARCILETRGITGIPAQSLGTIASGEGIKYKQDNFTDDWDGALLFKGNKRAILINTHQTNKKKINIGRVNFTFAHELGHHFLEHEPNYNENGQLSIRCSAADMTGGRNIEAEANGFAAALLMPEAMFRNSMLGADIDFALISSLATEYQVSKQACAYRVVEFIRSPCVVVFTNGQKITSIAESEAAKGFMQYLERIPLGTVANAVIENKQFQTDFKVCNPALWLNSRRQTVQLYSCTRGNGGYYMTILQW